MPDMSAIALMLGILFTIIVLFMAAAVVFKRKRKGNAGYSYEQRGQLFTPAELSFLSVLDEVVSHDECRYRVMGKVRVADVLQPASAKAKGKQARSLWWISHSRISQKHFDFVLCAPDTLKPLIAVELDDSSHRRARAQQRDSLLNDACKSAGFPLLRIPAKRNYDVGQIRELVVSASAS